MITIEVVGLERITKRLDELKPVLDENLFDAFEQTAQEIRDRARSLAPVGATGNLRRRTRVVPQRPRLTVRVRFAPHAHLVERGRQPGRMPPAARLEAWAKLRGLEGKEYVLARAIAAKGTRAHPFVSPALVGARAALNGRVERAIRQTLDRPAGVIAGGPGIGV